MRAWVQISRSHTRSQAYHRVSGDRRIVSWARHPHAWPTDERLSQTTKGKGNEEALTLSSGSYILTCLHTHPDIHVHTCMNTHTQINKQEIKNNSLKSDCAGLLARESTQLVALKCTCSAWIPGNSKGNNEHVRSVPREFTTEGSLGF